MDRSLILDNDAPAPRATFDAPYIGYLAAMCALVLMIIA